MSGKARRYGWVYFGSMMTCLLAFVGPSLRSQDKADPFKADVRPTEALSPEEQLKKFRLPEGFRIELFAAEPDIQKPMNIAFDSSGRLWVSCSTEYPYSAPAGSKGRDSIRILQSTKGNGRADKVTVFADGLNIPIGLYPYKSGVVAFSIPNISFYQDGNGDGRADKREILYGPFDTSRDTHGMNNSFRRGFDGWLYANHGYSNFSRVKGRDGSSVEMQSGNTYRVRLDGSRIEQFTFGQVNPFGSTFDPHGDLINADCHTKPITLVMERGYYDSFGKPHNGLGYVPPVMTHDHGSTAIAGTTQYTGSNFPPEYHGNLFVGNVMTSRVNRDSLRYHGSSMQAIEEPDFIACDDPWFRPVDLQVGPDGALYIADFYNKIIGHYEVALTHPGRDRHRGRIWRVTYVGKEKQPKLDPVVDLRLANVPQLIASLSHPNLGVRLRATDELTDRAGKDSIVALKRALEQASKAEARVQAAWALFRLHALEDGELARLAQDKDRLARIHAMRILGSLPALDRDLGKLLQSGLADADALARRAAVQSLGSHPSYVDLERLLALHAATPTNDEHLRHAIKLTLLERLRLPGSLDLWRKTSPSKADAALMADIALALPTQESGAYLLEFLKRFPPAGGDGRRFLTHAARHLPESTDIEALASIARKNAANDLDLQSELLAAVRGGLRQRGAADPEVVRAWGGELAGRLLESLSPGKASAWSCWTLEGEPGPTWQLERRQATDGRSGLYLSSLPLGEAYTGSLRSQPFVLPERLSFYLCGHSGFPKAVEIPKSLVRLRLANSGEVICQTLPPRSDVARKVEWRLSPHAGKQAYLEVIDGLDLAAYAWIAISRFDPPIITLPTLSPETASKRLASVAVLARELGLQSLLPGLRSVLGSGLYDLEAQAEAARSVIAFHPSVSLAALAETIPHRTLPATLRWRILDAVKQGPARDSTKLASEIARLLPRRMQIVLSTKLAESREGAELLLRLATEGHVSPQVLREPVVSDRLKAIQLDKLEARIEALTKGMPTLERELQRLVDLRRIGYARAQASPERGKAAFVKHCQACHQIAGQGIVIGPQLDGIGERGLERLVEDILDPNRNVDPTFTTTVYTLKDGRLVTGLFRRQEGQSIVVADTAGKEITLAQSAIEDQAKSKTSLMPTSLGTALSDAEFYDLMAYLLAQRTPAKKP